MTSAGGRGDRRDGRGGEDGAGGPARWLHWRARKWYDRHVTWTAFKSDWTPPKVYALSGSGLIDDFKGLTGPPIKGEKYEGPSFLQRMNPFSRG